MDIFCELAPALEAHGYESLPVRPGGKAPGFDDWTRHRPPAEHIAAGRGAWGVGILARTTPAVDLDVRDPATVRELHDLALSMLGAAPVRVGWPPKALLPYRGGAPFSKRVIAFALAGDDISDPEFKPHKIEIPADGQPFIAFAIHPDTRRPYRWYRGSPLDIPRGELPPLTAAAAAGFLAAATDLLTRRGARLVAARGRGGGKPPGRRVGGKPPRPVVGGDAAERVGRALFNIPVSALTYDDWIEVGLAVKSALGDGPKARELWVKWSAQHKDSRRADCEAKWATLNPRNIGAGTIFYLEKLHGR